MRNKAQAYCSGLRGLNEGVLPGGSGNASSISNGPRPILKACNSSCRATGAVHPLRGWTDFEGNSKSFRFGMPVFPALLRPRTTIGRLSTGLIPSLLRQLGESCQQVLSRLPTGIRFVPCPSMGLAALPEREERFTSATRTGLMVKKRLT